MKFENQHDHYTPPVAMHVESDECERRETEFSLHFTTDGAGYGFDCLSDGTVIMDRLNNISLKSLHAAQSQEWERIHVRAHTHRIRLCMCGSGKESDSQYDARGIYLTATCSKCHKDKMSRYRTEVLTDGNYECDELVEADY